MAFPHGFRRQWYSFVLCFGEFLPEPFEKWSGAISIKCGDKNRFSRRTSRTCPWDAISKSFLVGIVVTCNAKGLITS